MHKDTTPTHYCVICGTKRALWRPFVGRPRVWLCSIGHNNPCYKSFVSVDAVAHRLQGGVAEKGFIGLYDCDTGLKL